MSAEGSAMSLSPLPGDAIARLVDRDGSLFSSDPAVADAAARLMGWTRLAEDAATTLPALEELAREVRAEGLADVVLLGMGGSSLAALVISEVLAGDGVRMHVLDTTCPTTVTASLASTDPATTIHLVSSKSGSTTEPNALYAIFRAHADAALGRTTAGARFIAITDPGSPLEDLAKAEGFRATVLAPPQVGGRFSALTAFGLLPAALLGVNVRRLVDRALRVEHEFTQEAGDTLLAHMMVRARDRGDDKLTLVAPPALRSFGVWVEQLVAESLGKHGTGIVPVIDLNDAPELPDNEIRLVFSRTGHDHLRAEETVTDEARSARFTLAEPGDLGGWFVLWEYSTALAGAAMGLNPFDQPNVARAKEATAAVLAHELSAPTPQIVADGAAITYAGSLAPPTDAAPTLASALAHGLASVRPGDYVALLAYLPEDSLAPLAAVAPAVSGALDAAVCLELGPRYLHSTGQLHKGGPATGVFVVLTAEDSTDIAVPGKPWTLRRLFEAQAEGDLATLADLGRRVMHVHLASATSETISRFAEALMGAPREHGQR